jgi:hypothetical protein
MSHFLLGAIVMASIVAGLLFLRYWRDTRDRFFLLFALAFWVLAANWLGLAVVAPGNEARSLFYLVRWLGFCLILIAIAEKNRSRGNRP